MLSSTPKSTVLASKWLIWGLDCAEFNPQINSFGVKVVDLGVGMWVSD